MEQKRVMDLLVLEKKVYGKLVEVMDLTEQLSEAVSRRDQVSVELLVSMRQEPMNQLRLADEQRRQAQAALSEKDRAELDAILAGGAPEGSFEQMLSAQTLTSRRLLEKAAALDRRVSTRLGGEDSCYAENGTAQ